MENRIEDYLHLYIGCEFIYDYQSKKGIRRKLEGIDLMCYNEDFKNCKLLLRTFSDMTKDEKFERCTIITKYGKEFIDAEYHRWMLSKGFDLFGLIEKGLAIDKTKIK